MNIEQGFSFIISSIWFNFASQVEDQLDKNNIPLTSDQFRLCSILSESKDILTQQDLADLLDRDRSAITRMIQILEKKGIVIRTDKPDDKRSYLITLTPEGKKMVITGKRIGRKIIDQVFKGFSPDEEVLCIRYFEKIKTNLSQ